MSTQKKYSVVFIVLVYRNTQDLVEFIKCVSDKASDYKIIVVDSFYSENTKKEFEEIANNNSCDFISVPNKGYGAGNNRGIELALRQYEFDYLVISNPDIEINHFSVNKLQNEDNRVYGPLIITSRGKNQNPYWAIRNKFTELLIYKGYKSQNRLLIYMGTGVNKVVREIFLSLFKLSSRQNATVFALHGSFVIFPKKLLERLGIVYDEALFLFSEEADLAHRFYELDVDCVITKEISVKHKEDGSMALAKIDESSELRKSTMYYYEKYFRVKDDN